MTTMHTGFPVVDIVATGHRARWVLLALHLPMLSFVILAGATDLTGYPSTDPVIPVTAGLAIGALQLYLSFAVARDERPRLGCWCYAAVVLLAVLPLPAIGYRWMLSLWFVGAAGAMVTRGRARALAVALPAVAFVVLSVTEGGDLGYTATQQAWRAGYGLVVVVMGSVCLYGGARLVSVVDELFATRTRLAAQAVGGERRRVSHDLHDTLGQSLSAISLKGDLALRLLHADPDAAAREVESLAEVTAELVREVRAVARHERAASLAEETEGAVELLRATGVDANVRVDLKGLAPEIDTLFGWAVREGVTNVLRHSHARRCAITVFRDNGWAWLEIVNDGVSGSRDGHGAGLAGLAERAHDLHGLVSAQQVDGRRYRLRLVVEQEHR